MWAKQRRPTEEEALKEIEEQVEEIEEKVEAPIERRQTTDHGPSLSTVNRPLSLGERVHVGTLNADGVVTALGESDVEVQIGSLRVRARLADIMRKGQETTVAEKEKKEERKPEAEGNGRAAVSGTKSPGIELNLRGKLVEDGLDELDRYLERAYAAGLPFVRIVHGKGTGRMREAVREALKDSPLVSSFEEADEKEGGAGVTIAHMGER